VAPRGLTRKLSYARVSRARGECAKLKVESYNIPNRRHTMARNKHKKKNNNGRNWLAVHAHFKTGAGDHGDKKKHKNKKACRGKVTQ
jgi:hypothetical protein